MKELLKQALDALESASGNINPERGYADEVEADITAAIAAMQAALDAPDQPPELFGWMVSGVPTVMRGSLAEAIQKNEAKRIGGTCVAFPVYAHPRNIVDANKKFQATDWSAA